MTVYSQYLNVLEKSRFQFPKKLDKIANKRYNSATGVLAPVQMHYN